MSFFEKYFIRPTENLSGYNIVNTLTYATIFILSSYVIYLFIKREKIQINKEFLISILPYAFLGIFMRLQVDYNRVNPTLLTVTPGVWIKAFFIWLGIYIVSKFIYNKYLSNANKLKEKLNVYRLTGFLGVLILTYFIISNPLIIGNYFYFGVYILLLVIIIALMYKEKFYELIVIGQIIDATGSYLGITKGFYEEHVVANYIISNFGLVYFPIIKILAAMIIVYYLKNIDLDNDLKKYISLVAFLIGFGPGTRNWFLLMYK